MANFLGQEMILAMKVSIFYNKYFDPMEESETGGMTNWIKCVFDCCDWLVLPQEQHQSDGARELEGDG